MTINKPIDEITSADLQALLDDQVRESKTIEYKRELDLDKTEHKHKLLATISSFANSGGGHLIIGLDATDGVPESFVGTGIYNEDQERLRIEQICRSGIEPRLPKFEIKFVSMDTAITVIVIWIAKSWNAPHRVRNGAGGGYFYGRHSAGNFPMDVSELRTAFTQGTDVALRISDFRRSRVAAIHDHDTPTAIPTGCKMVIHILPLTAFTTNEKFDIGSNYSTLCSFAPLGRSEGTRNHRINLEGIINYSNPNQEGKSYAYTQINRNGTIEAAVVLGGEESGKYIHSVKFEKHILEAFDVYSALLKRLQVTPPYYVFLSFIGSSGYQFRVPCSGGIGYIPTEIDSDILMIPEIVIADEDGTGATLLRPLFDMAWNGFGYPASQNYDIDGQWVGANA